MGRQALGRLGASEAKHFQGRRGVEYGAGLAQPVVQGVFGPADRALRAAGQIVGGLQGGGLKIGVLDAQRDQADTLGLGAGQRLAGHQVIFGFGHAAQQRPDDAGDIAGGDAQAGMTVDDFGRLPDNRDIREDANHPASMDPPAVADLAGGAG